MFLIILFLTFFLNYSPILASDTRNIFGLHLTQTSDILKAKDIINSSNGDWGYVTIVIRLDQLDKHNWQNFMDECRRSHLIPILRLATIMDNNTWKIPEPSDIDHIVDFLNSLNWPTKTRHVIPFNEVNHATEWGGIIDIKSFTDIFIYTSLKLRSSNPNYFILSSPPDLAAPDKLPNYLSATNFYRQIFSYKPEYFDSFDGLASHSYPNHGYVGSPADSGRLSIQGYKWEQSFIKSLGISKKYPVFITETGWPHKEGEESNNRYYTSKTTAKFLMTAFNLWKLDPDVVAVTPFIYNYPYEPFDHFSWVDKQENLYPEYQQIIDLPKNKNSPQQITSFEVITNNMPLIIFTDYEYGGQIVLKNTGQSIWGETTFCLIPNSSTNITVDSLCIGNEKVEPGFTQILNYKFRITQSTLSDTFLGWHEINSKYQITPIVAQGHIYSPKLSIWDKTIQFIKGFSL